MAVTVKGKIEPRSVTSTVPDVSAERLLRANADDLAQFSAVITAGPGRWPTAISSTLTRRLNLLITTIGSTTLSLARGGSKHHASGVSLVARRPGGRPLKD